MADAGDGGDYDPCECVLSQEWATRRLINMIRQSQDYCTENECYTEGGNSSDPTGATAMFFMGFWLLLAMVLFFLRPKTSIPGSKSGGAEGPNLDPPAPTAT